MDQTTANTTITVLVLMIGACVIFLVRFQRQARMLRAKYGRIIDVDGELSSRKARTEEEIRLMLATAQADISACRGSAASELADLQNACTVAQARAEGAQRE